MIIKQRHGREGYYASNELHFPTLQSCVWQLPLYSRETNLSQLLEITLFIFRFPYLYLFGLPTNGSALVA